MSSHKYPIYIISKGRWEKRHTAKFLELANVDYRIVIEPQEKEQYESVIDPGKILVLPFSNLGQGSIPARNWVWDHSLGEGHFRHWILDDNIRWFARLQSNKIYQVRDDAIFSAAEDFVDRYTNVGMAGFQYYKFIVKGKKYNPISMNTRIYSCILIQNNTPYRWRGRYNEDTDLSLRLLKNRWCTILFNAFLAEKITTMTTKGGNTDEVYADTNNRLEFAKSLQSQHPDVVKVVWKYNRWHHHVDYRPFKNNKLIRKRGVEIPKGVNNYGMKLVKASSPN